MEYENFLKEIVKTCKTKADLCRALDKKPTGGNYKTIDNIIKKYNLDITHFSKEPWNKGINYISPKHKLEDLLVENSPYKSTFHLKKRLINEGLKEHKCEICGYTENVELHHINGDPTNNRLENLQMLCPNCHSKTENFRAKNIKCKVRTHNSPEELILDEDEARLRQESRKLAHRKNISIEKAQEMILNTPNKSINDIPLEVHRLENKICPICEKEFHPRNHEQVYCSPECVAKSQRKVEITKEQLIQLAVDKNCNFTQMGKELGVSDNAVRKYCDKFDIPRKRKDLEDYIKNSDDPNYVKPENTKMNRTHDFDLICEIYKEGYSQKDIAAYIGCCQDTVRKALLQNNIPIRSKSLQKIGRYSLDGELLQVYYSGEEAMLWLFNQGIAKSTGGNHHIFECCRKKVQSAYGFKWEYIPKKPITEFK